MQTQEIRRRFLNYFAKNGHVVLSSSPVVPHEDPTLLFTNAGMNQFKDIFLGKTQALHGSVTTSQKCIRVGGKHNDLENVGHTSRHLTFFEMLGNFSFGEYFKEQAIKFAWEVSTEVFGFPEERLWPTVFEEDEEAFVLWKKYVPEKKISRIGAKDNFWAMGETGPCGPCSELFYDRGEKFGQANTLIEDVSGERFFEFWNLVFMQYNQPASGSRESLPRPSIDTGSGLERVASLLQNKENVFETDILRSIIAQIEQISGKEYSPKKPLLQPAFCVIADHLRCLAFAIADGAQPSNVERGYVLRKIVRRAVRYGKILDFNEPFLAKILPRLVREMSSDYKELLINQNRIADILSQEEEAFFKTLKRGGSILQEVIEHAKEHEGYISGKDAFTLKDTYGMPLDEVLLIAKDNNLSVDTEAFMQKEQEAKEKSKAGKKQIEQSILSNIFEPFLEQHGPCHFLRESLVQDAYITAILKENTFVQKLEVGEEGILLLNQTPFYAEMGGQVGDTGEINSEDASFIVSDCQTPFTDVITHAGKVKSGSFSVGSRVSAKIDQKQRTQIANNHTATHLLHWALHKVLGEHARQAGSVVDAHRLRFDFFHHKPLTKEELTAIEHIVSDKIRENSNVNTYTLTREEVAKKDDIKQFFGEKYGNLVRVVDIAGYAKELCYGTHIDKTGSIGYFRIVKEQSIASGVRRIEAITGHEAELFALSSEESLKEIAHLLDTIPSHIKERIQELKKELEHLRREVKAFHKEKIALFIQKTTLQTSEKGIPYISTVLPFSPKEAKSIMDALQKRHKDLVILFGIEEQEKVHLILFVSDHLVEKGTKANTLLQSLLPFIEGTGGGKPGFAQGAGKNTLGLQQALLHFVTSLDS